MNGGRNSKELAANRNGAAAETRVPELRVGREIFPLNALNCKNSFVSRSRVRQTDEKYGND